MGGAIALTPSLPQFPQFQGGSRNSVPQTQRVAAKLLGLMLSWRGTKHKMLSSAFQPDFEKPGFGEPGPEQLPPSLPAPQHPDGYCVLTFRASGLGRRTNPSIFTVLVGGKRGDAGYSRIAQLPGTSCSLSACWCLSFPICSVQRVSDPGMGRCTPCRNPPCAARRLFLG